MSLYELWVLTVRMLCYLSIPAVFLHLSMQLITLVWKYRDERWLSLFLPKRNNGNTALFQRAFTVMSFAVILWWLAEYTRVIDTVSFYFGVCTFFIAAITEVGINDLWRHKVSTNNNYE